MPCYSLAISHATRVAVNRKYNLAQKLSQLNAVLYKARASTHENRPQSFWTCAGAELIGADGRARRGLFHTVLSATPERLTLEVNGETLSLSADMAAKRLRLSHCITYASCQGLSLQGVRLLETNSPHFTWRHLYVGSSRCTSNALLEVC